MARAFRAPEAEEEEGGDHGSPSACDVCCLRHHALPDAHYDPRSWLQTVFAWNGSVLPAIIYRSLLWLAVYVLLYVVQTHDILLSFTQHNPGEACLAVFSVFFTNFRLNGSHGRYMHGLQLLESALNTFRNIISSTISYMDKSKPATEPEDVAACTAAKRDLLRFTLLTGVLMKLQNRLTHEGDERRKLLQLDLVRCRGLLYENEFRQLESHLGVRNWRWTSDCCKTSLDMGKRSPPVPHWAVQRLRLYLGSACMRGSHGFVERVLNILEKELASLDASVTDMVFMASIPPPVAYVQMARVLMMVFLVIFPLHIRPEDGAFNNIFYPFMTAVIFHAMDEICTNMEDPYGDDPSDLKVVTHLSDVEEEMMLQLEETNDPTHAQFEWSKVLPDDEWLWPRGVRRFICLTSEQRTMEAMRDQVEAT